MNRYRTIPGIGPSASKATSTTTCQKCLKKGHYSYECKASVQNRPYISRPSRSQQLQNPKLMPALVEQKMEEPEATPVDAADTSRVPQNPEPEVRVDTPQDDAQDATRKRRRTRSASVSSVSSVATISTIASDTGAKPMKSRNDNHDRRSRSSTTGRPRTPPSVRNKQDNKHHDGDESTERSRSRTGTPPQRHHDSSDSEEHSRSSAKQRGSRHDRKDTDRRTQRKRDRPEKRQRSRSAESLPDARPQDNGSKLARQRSLSPYSRRIALTQAMNVGR